jgi:hypothetical protein
MEMFLKQARVKLNRYQSVSTDKQYLVMAGLLQANAICYRDATDKLSIRRWRESG